MMASMMTRLILPLLLVTSAIRATLPINSGLDSRHFTHGFTEIHLYKLNATSGDPLLVPDNGTLFNPNPSAFPIVRVCVGSNVPACAFGAEDGTWIAASNNTDYACVDISPPLVLNNGFCCISLDDCALLDHPFLLARAEDALLPSTLTTLTLTSNDNGPRLMNVRADGVIFSFTAVDTQALRVCVSDDAMGCVFKAVDGTAYAASTLSSSSCVDIDSTKPLDHGFCCEDFTSCPGLKNLRSRSPVADHVRDILQSRRPFVRGPVANNVLHILFEGAPDLVGWEFVYTNLKAFSVAERIPWAVGQICTMDDHALCAFVGKDSTVTAVIGGQDSNCAVVAPPQVLVDGLCCASPSQCNASDHETLAQLVGPAAMASFMGTNTTNTAIASSRPTLATRETNVKDITVEYYGPSDDYALQFVTGDYSVFSPSATWGVDQVCIISPQGFCGFWSADENLGFEVGPVVAGQSSACYTVGGAYVLAGGICCRSSDDCDSKRSAKPLSIRDITTSDTTPVTRHITFYGDPAVYVEAGGVTTVLQILGDGHIEQLQAMGEPVVEVCVDNGGSCQFYLGGLLELGPAILTGKGGCLGFQPSITLTAVACN